MSTRLWWSLALLATLTWMAPATAHGQARRGGGWDYDPYDRGDGVYGGYGYARDVAFDRGYREGYDEGREAARDNDRYDPRREKDYRRGDDGYGRRYGSKDAYKQSYRSGFLRGYDRGYLEARSARSGRGWPW